MNTDNYFESYTFSVIGLGYVGLELALSLSNAGFDTIGFDLNEKRISQLKKNQDSNLEKSSKELSQSSLKFTSDKNKLDNSTHFFLAIPTPVDLNNEPDLKPLIRACELVGEIMKKGSTIIIESTVFPGVTEEICIPIIEKCSGLRLGQHFKVAYSPERINPGDKINIIDQVSKIVSASDEETLMEIKQIYGKFVCKEIITVSSIKIAEAAKLIENVQRDLNIALMNEFSTILDSNNIPTNEVLDAASSKWNFHNYRPGLVGGHCVSVDPYYLSHFAKKSGMLSKLILTARDVNDRMVDFLVGKILEQIKINKFQKTKCKIGILGVSFKENVSDLRNSKVLVLAEKLKAHGLICELCDPLVSSSGYQNKHGYELANFERLRELDAMLLAVPHDVFLDMGIESLTTPLKQNGVFLDFKSRFAKVSKPQNIKYWCL